MDIKLLIFLGYFIFYVALTGGSFWETDSQVAYQATTSIFNRLEFDTPCLGAALSTDGKCYSQYGLFMSIAILPFYLVDKIVIDLLGINYFFPGFFSSFTNPFITALSIVVFYQFLTKLNFNKKFALLGTFLLGVATYLPVYTKSLFSEPLLTLLFLSTFYLVLFGSKEKKIVTSGVLVGLAFLTKIASLIFLPIYIYIIFQSKNNLQKIIFFLIPLGISVLIFFAYNFIRFDNILDTGYRGIKFDTPFWYGLYLHTISPGKSFFLYQPIILFAFLGFKYFYKEHKKIFLTFSLSTLIQFIFYSIYMHPTGDLAWGSRYIYITLPFFICGVLYFLKNNVNRLLNKVFIFMLILSLCIQFSAVFLSYHRYFAFLSKKLGSDYTWYAHNLPEYSPLYGQWKLIFRIGYKEEEALFWKEAFQEYPPFTFNYQISPTDMFWLRSRSGSTVFFILAILEALIIKNLIKNIYPNSKNV